MSTTPFILVDTIDWGQMDGKAKWNWPRTVLNDVKARRSYQQIKRTGWSRKHSIQLVCYLVGRVRKHSFFGKEEEVVLITVFKHEIKTTLKGKYHTVNLQNTYLQKTSLKKRHTHMKCMRIMSNNWTLAVRQIIIIISYAMFGLCNIRTLVLVFGENTNCVCVPVPRWTAGAIKYNYLLLCFFTIYILFASSKVLAWLFFRVYKVGPNPNKPRWAYLKKPTCFSKCICPKSLDFPFHNNWGTIFCFYVTFSSLRIVSSCNIFLFYTNS